MYSSASEFVTVPFSYRTVSYRTVPYRTVPYRTVPFFVFRCIENFLKSFTVPYCFPLLLLKPRIVPLEKVIIFRFLLKARSISFEENNRFPFLYKKRDSNRTKVKIVFRYTKESANRTVLKKIEFL